MTGNGLYTTYLWWWLEDGLWHCFSHILYSASLCNARVGCALINHHLELIPAPWNPCRAAAAAAPVLAKFGRTLCGDGRKQRPQESNLCETLPRRCYENNNADACNLYIQTRRWLTGGWPEMYQSCDVNQRDVASGDFIDNLQTHVLFHFRQSCSG